jgi:hypothetical protein
MLCQEANKDYQISNTTNTKNILLSSKCITIGTWYLVSVIFFQNLELLS